MARNTHDKSFHLFQILFEHLSVPAVYLANQLVLSLYASGLTRGMSLSSGFSVTQAAAICEGHLLAYTVQELDIGGQALTDNLQKLLRQNKGHNFNSSSGWQIVNNMKETMAYVAKGNTGMEGVTLMQIWAVLVTQYISFERVYVTAVFAIFRSN